ncbi:transmembrane protease serine 3-like [Tropilaelaps mercedesae]|uniref:Transmembrane protease serine 3-like n=1 Tax=Tropilaelaps mercedesae TaxID=418985 RepID=A0A1V9XMS1_9ACAR|nr:transmembrane protease serine 3-like [Tropilaelaps mercedesae]
MKVAVALLSVLLVSVTALRCGQRNNYSALSTLTANNSDTYVVGGSEALPHEFPWQISFQMYYRLSWWQPKKWHHNCGGSIINDQWIVTAAHCYDDHLSLENLRIVVGTHDLTRNESAIQTFGINMIINHPEYNMNNVENDIALIKIAGRLNLDGISAAPICLPTLSDANTFDRATCVATGWGKTAHGGRFSDVLLKVNLPVVSNSVCSILYRNVQNARITSDKICAGRLDREGFGVCEGDSGGPLACHKNGEYQLAGVTSFGVFCGSSRYPTVHTRVSTHRTWIDTVLSIY